MKALYICFLFVLTGCIGIETQVEENRTVGDNENMIDNGLSVDEGLTINEVESNDTLNHRYDLSQQESTQEYPPITFNYNAQGRLLTIVGAESSASWDNTLLEFSEDSDIDCRHDAPIQGPMRPGDVVHFSLNGQVRNATCSIMLYYNDNYLQTWQIVFEE